MLTLQLTKSEIALLNYERFYYPCALVRKRLQAVYFKATEPLTNQETARLCDLHHRTVSKWVNTYKKQGITALYEFNYGTNKSALEAHQTKIVNDLTAHPVVSLAEAKSRIEHLSGLSRSLTQIRIFLKKHGFRYKKLGHIPAKADVEQQEQWLENQLQPQIQLAQAGKTHLLFVDAAHFVFSPFVCCLWTITRLFIKAPAGRQRLNVIGAVNAITKKVLFQWNTTVVNAETLINFLLFLKAQLPDLPIIIVLDNARYQHCKAVKELAQSLGITLLFLPPYSPNLNIIERLWRLVKKKCLYAKYYGNFGDFQKAIVQCLSQENEEFINQVRKLLILKFQTFKNVTFYPV